MLENSSRSPRTQSDDGRRTELTAADESTNSPHATGENSLWQEGGAGTGVKSWKRTVLLWAPIFIAVLSSFLARTWLAGLVSQRHLVDCIDHF